MLKTFWPYLVILFSAVLLGFMLANFQALGAVAFLGLLLAVILGLLLIRDINWGLYLIAFFLPFERIPSIEIAGISLRINHLIVTVTFLVFLTLGLATKKLKVRLDKTFILIGFFLIANFISLTSALDLGRAIQVLIFILFVLMVYFLTTNLVTNSNVLKNVILALIFSAAIEGILGIYQFLGDLAGLPLELTGLKEGYDKSTFGFARVHGSALEPLYFANFLFIPLGLAISSILSKKSILPKGSIWPILVLVLINFALTVSRGAYLGFIFFLIILGIFYFKRLFNFKNIFIAGATIFVVGLGIWFFLSRAEPEAIDEFVSHVKVEDYTKGESVNARVKAYQEAWTAFSEKPYFGIGPGNYGPFAEGYPQERPESGWPIVNNQYLEALAENGIVGLSILILLFLVVLYRAIRAYFKTKDLYFKTIIIGMIAALVGILVQYNFFSTIYIIHIWFLLGLLTATVNLASQEFTSRVAR